MRNTFKKAQEGKQLLKDDLWMWSQLSEKLQKQNYCKLSQFERIVDWKMTRGLFRPRNKQLLSDNGESDVEKYSREAFEMADSQPKKAISLLCKLKGIGPATASALLAVYCPEKYAFMSDEGMTTAGLPLKYTEKAYADYKSAIDNKINALPFLHDWSANDVQQALWCYTIIKKFKYEELLYVAVVKSKKATKRVRQVDENEEPPKNKKNKKIL